MLAANRSAFPPQLPWHLASVQFLHLLSTCIPVQHKWSQTTTWKAASSVSAIHDDELQLWSLLKISFVSKTNCIFFRICINRPLATLTWWELVLQPKLYEISRCTHCYFSSHPATQMVTGIMYLIYIVLLLKTSIVVFPKGSMNYESKRKSSTVRKSHSSILSVSQQTTELKKIRMSSSGVNDAPQYFFHWSKLFPIMAHL